MLACRHESGSQYEVCVGWEDVVESQCSGESLWVDRYNKESI